MSSSNTKKFNDLFKAGEIGHAIHLYEMLTMRQDRNDLYTWPKLDMDAVEKALNSYKGDFQGRGMFFKSYVAFQQDFEGMKEVMSGKETSNVMTKAEVVERLINMVNNDSPVLIHAMPLAVRLIKKILPQGEQRTEVLWACQLAYIKALRIRRERDRQLEANGGKMPEHEKITHVKLIAPTEQHVALLGRIEYWQNRIVLEAQAAIPLSFDLATKKSVANNWRRTSRAPQKLTWTRTRLYHKFYEEMCADKAFGLRKIFVKGLMSWSLAEAQRQWESRVRGVKLFAESRGNQDFEMLGCCFMNHKIMQNSIIINGQEFPIEGDMKYLRKSDTILVERTDTHMEYKLTFV